MTSLIYSFLGVNWNKDKKICVLLVVFFLSGEWYSPWLTHPTIFYSMSCCSFCLFLAAGTWRLVKLGLKARKKPPSRMKNAFLRDFYSRSPRRSQSKVCCWLTFLSSLMILRPRPVLAKKICHFSVSSSVI